MNRALIAGLLAFGAETIAAAQSSGWSVHTLPTGYRAERICIDSTDIVRKAMAR